MAMSYDLGKSEVCDWINKNFPPSSIMLDVGAGEGKWAKLLPEYRMDACEAFEPNAMNLLHLYCEVFCCNITDLKYQHYDLVIFGDIIEHLSVKDAQKVINYAKEHCDDMIVAVPFLYPQGELYGNPYERHIQDDLTPEIFDERYPGFEPLWSNNGYCYYHRKETSNEQ